MRISDWSSDVCSSDLSVVVADAAAAAERVGGIGFPLAVKVASRDIAHRSELGGVVLGVNDMDGLAAAIARIAASVAAAAPGAAIDGYELQREVRGDRSEEHTSELTSLMRNSYAVISLKKTTTIN